MTSNLTCAKFLNRLFEGAVWHSSPASCRDELPERIEFITDHTEPVSYTHLDVYKRQPIKEIRRSKNPV